MWLDHSLQTKRSIDLASRLADSLVFACKRAAWLAYDQQTSSLMAYILKTSYVIRP
jgi:hypothetical protein